MLFSFFVYLFLSCFFCSCAYNKLTKRNFSSLEEMMFFIKEDFKKELSDVKDTIYYFPPITSKINGDTMIVMFASCKPTIIKGNVFFLSRKNRVLGDTTIVLMPSRGEIIYKGCLTEYHIDKKKLKILKLLENQ